MIFRVSYRLWNQNGTPSPGAGVGVTGTMDIHFQTARFWFGCDRTFRTPIGYELTCPYTHWRLSSVGDIQLNTTHMPPTRAGISDETFLYGTDSLRRPMHQTGPTARETANFFELRQRVHRPGDTERLRDTLHYTAVKVFCQSRPGTITREPLYVNAVGEFR